MDHKLDHLHLEWVVVSKRRIGIVIALCVLTLLLLAGGLYLSLYGNPFQTTRDDAAAIEATRFKALEGEVRVVRSQTREMMKADGSTRLYPGDVVQTQATGRASLTLADGSTLSIHPNSVITIAENTGTKDGGFAHVRVAVEGGRVKMNTERQTPQTRNIVETPVASSQLSGQTAVAFDVHEDKTEEIRVSAGSVEANMRGVKTTIRAGEYIALSRSGDIERRERLLDTLVPYAPTNLERIQMRADGTASVNLRWSYPMAASAASYRIEIALSPFFVKPGIVFERDHLTAPRLVVTELSDGNYFWRVRAITATGQASEWCEPQKFTIIPHTNKPDPENATARAVR